MCRDATPIYTYHVVPIHLSNCMEIMHGMGCPMKHVAWSVIPGAQNYVYCKDTLALRNLV